MIFLLEESLVSGMVNSKHDEHGAVSANQFDEISDPRSMTT